MTAIRFGAFVEKLLSTAAVLTGRTEDHLQHHPQVGCLLHRELVAPLSQLREAARAAGFDLAVASAFRSFDRQCLIWNQKVAGQRPVVDDSGTAVDLSQLDEWAQARAILRWSALPGASRHHWGTDLDIFDRGSLYDGYPGPQLTAPECGPGGVFHRFHRWLDDYLPGSDFYRPYAVDRGGIGCEPWHISYRPIAALYQQALTEAVLRQAISHADIALRETVLARLGEIHQRYIALT